MAGEDLSCREFVTFLVDYVEQGLPVEERLAFEAHLAECPDCVSYLDGYRKGIALQRVAFDSDDAVPESVPRELVAAILALRPNGRRR